MRRILKWSLLAVTMAMVAIWMADTEQPTLAQGPLPPRAPIDVQAFNACTTTDYGALAAKALNMSVVDVRKAIISGQTLQQIASTANVPLQTVADAVQAARNADIDQSVKDGVMTQDEATALEAPPSAPGTAPAPNGTAQARPQGNLPNVQFPDISTFSSILQQMSGTAPTQGAGPRGGAGGFGGFGLGSGIFNLVKQYEVAATALNLKCPDLVKTLIIPPGKSIVTVAADQKIDQQTIADALTKAYQTALAQDVTDGVITQDQSTQLSAIIPRAVTTFINNPLPMGVQPTLTPTP